MIKEISACNIRIKKITNSKFRKQNLKSLNRYCTGIMGTGIIWLQINWICGILWSRGWPFSSEGKSSPRRKLRQIFPCHVCMCVCVCGGQPSSCRVPFTQSRVRWSAHTVACRQNATTAAIIIPIKANASKRTAGAWSCVFTPGSLLFAAHTCSNASHRRRRKLVTDKASKRQVEILVHRKMTVAKRIFWV